MDFIVELSDGSIVNVEIQQVGYAFPGERANCYLSDLIMRQYNLIKSERGKRFSYHDMKPAILIVFMESSSAPFLAVAPRYIHREQNSFDSGAKVPNLTHTVYISLDTFRSVVHNISTELDAWLTFLSSDRPADIVKLVNAYPEFLSCYQDIVEFRRHPKELMTMFSEALYMLDHNTELYMIDEMKKQLAEQKKALAEKENALAEKDRIIAEKDTKIKELENSR